MSSSTIDEDDNPYARRPHNDIPDGEQQSRIDRARQDGARRVPGKEAPRPEIEAALREAGLLDPAPIPVVQDAYRIKGRTHVVEDRESSSNPDFKLIDDAYEITAPDKSWFVVTIQPNVAAPERMRRFVERQGCKAYWPRSVRVVSRGNGGRKRDVVLVKPAFASYALVHLPQRSCDGGGPPFGALTGDEGQFYGVGRFVEFGSGPMSVPDVLVQHILSQENQGIYDETVFKRTKRVSKLPEWVEVGAMVRIVDGPFASFPGTIEAVDEEKSRVRVAVAIFGRISPVDMELAQVVAMR